MKPPAVCATASRPMPCAGVVNLTTGTQGERNSMTKIESIERTGGISMKLNKALKNSFISSGNATSLDEPAKPGVYRITFSNNDALNGEDSTEFDLHSGDTFEDLCNLWSDFCTENKDAGFDEGSVADVSYIREFDPEQGDERENIWKDGLVIENADGYNIYLYPDMLRIINKAMKVADGRSICDVSSRYEETKDFTDDEYADVKDNLESILDCDSGDAESEAIQLVLEARARKKRPDIVGKKFAIQTSELFCLNGGNDGLKEDGVVTMNGFRIEKHTDDGSEYYDLYSRDGDIAACDGETCQVIEFASNDGRLDDVRLMSKESVSIFTLSYDEFEKCCAL